MKAGEIIQHSTRLVITTMYKNIKLCTISLLLTTFSYGQVAINDSILISKEQLNEIYSFLNSNIKWIEENPQENGIELDIDCKWMWRLRDELKEIKE